MKTTPEKTPCPLRRVQLKLSGPGRRLSLSGSAACSAQPSGCALDAGGASRHFLVADNATLLLGGLVLSNGYALQGGCVLALRGGALNASAVTFQGCAALGDGGALLALSGASASLDGCLFTGTSSRAGFGGGAAALFGSSLLLSDCAFVNCTATSGGAFVSAYASTANASNVSISGCFGQGYGGGAMAFYNSTLAFVHSDIFNSTAVYGGSAIGTWRGCTLVLEDSSIQSCNAASAGGSTIFSGHGPLAEITRSSIVDNCLTCCDGCDTAGQGSIVADHTRLVVVDSVIAGATKTYR